MTNTILEQNKNFFLIENVLKCGCIFISLRKTNGHVLMNRCLTVDDINVYIILLIV